MKKMMSLMNLRLTLIFAVAALLLVTSAWPAPAQDVPQAGGTVTGLVVNSLTSVPINGATVYLYNNAGSFVATGTTNFFGVFTITSVPAGQVRARAFAVNYDPIFYDDKLTLAEATTFTVTEGGTTSGINFGLPPYAIISTTVVRSSTGENITSGAQMTIYSTDGLTSQTVNVVSGGASLLLQAGSYIVTAGGNNYVREYYDQKSTRAAAEVITVGPGETRSGIHFTLDDAGKISGRVTRSDGTTPIHGASVTAINLAGGDAITPVQTAADGTYLIHALAPGSYRVQATHPYYLSEFYNNSPTEGGAQIVAVTATVTTPSIDFTLDTFATVTGRVTRPDGTTPISGVTVTAVNPATGQGISTSTTGADGTYFLPFSAGAEFIVQGLKSGLLTEYYNNRYTQLAADVLDNRSGQNLININLTMAESSTASNFYPALTLPITAAKPNTAWRVATTTALTRTGEVKPALISTASSNNDGLLVFQQMLEPGTYTMRIKPSFALAQTVEVTLVTGTNTYTTPAFRVGDSDNNNVVNITDFSLLAASFGIASGGNGFDTNTDFNRDGVVNISDFSLLAESFGQAGAG